MKWFLGFVSILLFSSCASTHQERKLTSKAIDCPTEQVVISNKDSDYGRATWKAGCRETKKIYACSTLYGETTCIERKPNQL